MIRRVEGIEYPAITFGSNSGYLKSVIWGSEYMIINGYTISGMSLDEAMLCSKTCSNANIAPLENFDYMIEYYGYTKLMKWTLEVENPSWPVHLINKLLETVCEKN